MIFLASLVLFKLALTSLEHLEEETEIKSNFQPITKSNSKSNLETNQQNLTISEIKKELQTEVKNKSNTNSSSKYNQFIKQISHFLTNFLIPLNQFLSPVISRITPDLTFDNKKRGVKSLIWASFTIPFILGLDDFAGYVPLFSVVKVFGFGIGIFLGHFILNFFLFLNPDWTIKFIKNPLITILGSTAFVLLGFWGIWEVIHLLTSYYLH